MPIMQGVIAYPNIDIKVTAFRLKLLARRVRNEYQAWHEIFDHNRNLVKPLTKPRLLLANIPRLYKDLELAERKYHVQFFHGNLEVLGKQFSQKSKVRDIYRVLIMDFCEQETVAIMGYWLEQLNNPYINFVGTWKACKTAFVDGYTRSIHYQVIHKALGTRHKISHSARNEPFL